MRDHDRSYARRAAFTARSTSSAVADATSAIFFSFDGLIVAKYSPLVGGVNCPSMNRSYLSFSFTCPELSGAGAYVQSVPKFRRTSGLVSLSMVMARNPRSHHADTWLPFT